ncbi:MAG TPA: lipid-A-disaccharide synthase [Gemmatimonadales bacterium]|nr:lipid-A-disaccharide synthase [Gemmatimonadales bacterium]
MNNSPRIYISAGEPSADAHAAAVATALHRRLPGLELEALGGPLLERAGARVLDRMEAFSVVGFVEAIAKIPAHYRLLGRVKKAFREKRYDLVILVDYPGYHLRAAAAAAAAGIPVLYYIAPQMWAWGPKRVRKLAPVNQLAVILPFEEAFFREHGVAATFVGHPLKDRPAPPPRVDARRVLGLDPGRQVLGLFPGSRAQEVKRHWAIFREAAARVAAVRPDLQIIVAGTRGAEYPDPGVITIHQGDPLLVFAASDAGICKSGTTTLEAAIADVPMVITYRVHPISSFIAFRVLRVPWVGLVNLVAGYEVAPEFLQRRATAETLADGVLPLLDAAHPATRRQREGLQLVRDRLGAPGAADRVAELAAGLIR